MSDDHDVENTDTTISEDSSSTTTRRRHIPTRANLQEEFDQLVEVVNAEITNRRESLNTSTSIRFLQSLRNKIQTVGKHAMKIARDKRKVNRNTISGFLKPVAISKDLAVFTGFSDQACRADVTRFICKYVKEQDLVNPENRRQIFIHKDPKLAKLLQWDVTDHSTVRFCDLQKLINHHYL